VALRISNKQEVASALQSLADRNGGRITPTQVVAAAKDKTSPLHRCFTWDDAVAGHRHRLNEARELIQSIRVITHKEQRVVRGIAYVRDPEAAANQQGYISTAKLRTDEDLARAALVEEFSRAAAALRRAMAVAEVLQMKDEVERFVSGIDALRSQVDGRA
jgi:hypothetical protein